MRGPRRRRHRYGRVARVGHVHRLGSRGAEEAGRGRVTGLPADVAALVGVTQFEETADFPAERSYGWTSCASVQNANPLFWDDDLAARLTDGPTLPPTTLALW